MKKAILVGDYADPSIIRIEKDYYMVTSTYRYAPVFTIWHSTDLFNWEPIGNALDQFCGDVWAPDLVHYDNKFYIYYPSNKSNYVIWADQIEGPWSDPIDLKITQIDPGHCFDEEGNRYLYMNHGKRVSLSKDGLSVIDDMVDVYEPWPIPEDWEVECIGLEAPKIIKKGEYYYMISAEGGTSGPATSHMAVVSRSKNVLGPWEYAPHNPIVRTYSKEEPWWSQGHASFIDTPEGEWYLVYHGYKKDRRTLGRHVLISKVIWKEDGWPYVEEVEGYDLPRDKAEFVELSDSFTGDKLGVNWKLYDSGDFARLALGGQCLEMKGDGNSLDETSPLLVIPYSDSYEVQCEVTVENGVSMGGLTLFHSGKAYAYVGFAKGEICNGTMNERKPTSIDESVRTVFLKIVNHEEIVTFYYSYDGESWNKLIPTKDVSGYNHNTFNGSNLRIGIYSLGDGSVKFKDFIYKHMG